MTHRIDHVGRRARLNRDLRAFALAARASWETALPGHLTFAAEGAYASGDDGHATGAPDGNVSVLPTKEGVLPNGAGALKSKTALPTKAVLPSSGVLPEAGSNPGLPQATKALPDQGVLPRQGTPKKPDEPAAAPKETTPRGPPPKKAPRGATPRKLPGKAEPPPAER
jgi:hypothetical protein